MRRPGPFLRWALAPLWLPILLALNLRQRLRRRSYLHP